MSFHATKNTSGYTVSHVKSFLFHFWLEMLPIPVVIVYLNFKMHLNNKKLIFFTRLQKNMIPNCVFSSWFGNGA